MTKRNRSYWKKRAEAVAGKQFQKSDKYAATMVREYEKAKFNIQKDIIAFYERFAANNEIPLHEAKKLLRGTELKEFKMSLEEFTEKAKHNINGMWEKQLNNVSYKVRVSRLEALQTMMQNQIEALTDSQQKGMSSLLSDIYEDTYYRNIYEVHKGLGFGIDFAKLNTETIEKALTQQWLGENFSSRIWNNKNKLITELRTNLTQAFIRGDSVDKTAKILAKRLDVAKNRAITLVNTESAYISSQATKNSYKASGVVKQYENLATLDNHTSPICRSMDGKIFNVAEMQPGINAPPFHPCCRTTTITHFPDTVDEVRLARDHKGKIYKVNGDITYKEWYNEHVKSNPEELISEKKIKNRDSDKQQHKRYKEVLGKEIPKAFDEFQDLKYNDIEKWKVLKSDYRKLNAYNKIITNEPQITKDLKEISEVTNTKLVGLKFRFKTKESYLRKVNTDSLGSFDVEMIDKTINNTNDVIRYTYQAGGGVLVDKYNSITKELDKKNYKMLKAKNFWLNKRSSYKGVNCTFTSPTGQNFEIQFHTPESFELKNGRLHELYEEFRLPGTSKKRKQEIEMQMFDISKKLKEPTGIERIKPRR